LAPKSNHKDPTATQRHVLVVARPQCKLSHNTTERQNGGAASPAKGVKKNVLAAVLDPEHAAEVRVTDEHEID